LWRVEKKQVGGEKKKKKMTNNGMYLRFVGKGRLLQAPRKNAKKGFLPEGGEGV